MNLPLNPSRVVKFIQLGLAVATVAGCAAFTHDTPEQAVQKRATEYLQARIKGETAKAYALSIPSYRKVRTQAQFANQFGGQLAAEQAEVTQVSCESTKCTVRVKLLVKPALIGMRLGTIPMYIDEIWLLDDGQWWHYQEV